jgi:AcrR family transcriptional regulator
MRKKTDDRRKAIVEAAITVFRKMGYERASMTTISAKAGGTKMTTYNYFKSKDELFATAMFESMREQGEHVLQKLDIESDDIKSVLTNFGEAYLLFVCSPNILAVNRVAIAECATSAAGPILYEQGPLNAWDQVGTYLAKAMDRGSLRRTEPRIAAFHFKGLLEAGVIEPAQFGAKPVIEPGEAVHAAVECFMRAYACGGH